MDHDLGEGSTERRNNMPEEINTIQMPLDLPFPQSPNYCCGTYGNWSLEEKFGDSFERGYFTGFDVEPPGHYLVNDGDIWMSTSRLERESHAVHLKHAKGNVVVCGVGMGMFLFNIASQPMVDRIVAIDLDANVINLVRHATHFESWLGREKIRFVNKDALKLNPADIGLEQVDYLYVDIWPELGMAEAVAQTQMIQSVVKGQKVGWWGQEINFIDWLCPHKPQGHLPGISDLVDFMQAIGLPIEEQSAAYVRACQQAEKLFGTYRASLSLSSQG